MKHLLTRLLSVMFALNIVSTTAHAIAPRPVAFSYDALDRLLQVNYDDGKQINYTYDDMGNITSVKTRGTSPPVVIVNDTLNGTVSVPFTDYTVQVNTVTGVLGYAATGLPAGLKFNATMANNLDGKPSATIYGKPTTAGLYKVTLTARNITGTSTPQILVIRIANPFADVDDGYKLAAITAGFVGRSSIVGTELGGEISLTVTTLGGFTGTLKLGAKSYPLAGQFNALTGIANPITIARTGLSTLTVNLTLGLAGANRGSLTGTITDGIVMDTSSINAATSSWSVTNKATRYSGAVSTRYNIGLPIDAANVGVSAIPQGSGYCSITVGTTGVATIAGKLADSTAFSKAPVMWADGTVPVYVLLYVSKGYLSGTVQIDTGIDYVSTSDNKASGTLAWMRPSGTGYIYPAGFSTNLNAKGGAYVVPATGYRVLDLGNALINPTINLTLSRGWLSSDIVSLMTISSANLVTAFAPNNNTLSLVLTKTTGTFTGKFTVTSPTRIVTYQGMLIPAVSPIPARGLGWFLMPQTVAASTQLSGKAVIGDTTP